MSPITTIRLSLHESIQYPALWDWGTKVGKAVKKFIRNTQMNEEWNDEHLFIKRGDGSFLMKSVKASDRTQAHEAVFGRENDSRQYGFSYIPKYNIITVDERLSQEQVDEVVQEVKHRLKVTPIAMWNGWFDGDQWLVIAEEEPEDTKNLTLQQIRDATVKVYMEAGFKKRDLAAVGTIKSYWDYDTVLGKIIRTVKGDQTEAWDLQSKLEKKVAQSFGMSFSEFLGALRDAEGQELDKVD